MRQGAKRRMHNRVTKKVIKTLMKRTLEEVTSNDLDKAAASFKQAASKIDKAGARRVLHPNTAARRKSRLAREYAAAVAKAQQAKLAQPTES
jgi:small subunit ribosomal protein S20